MKISRLGILAASAVAGLIGTAAFAADDVKGDATGGDKACYHAHCGKSVKGHESKCAGSKVEDLKDQASCEGAGGAWATADEAKKFEN